MLEGYYYNNNLYVLRNDKLYVVGFNLKEDGNYGSTTVGHVSKQPVSDDFADKIKRYGHYMEDITS